MILLKKKSGFRLCQEHVFLVVSVVSVGHDSVIVQGHDVLSSEARTKEFFKNYYIVKI